MLVNSSKNNQMKDMEKGDTFVFYPSFYEDIKGITDDNVKLRILEAVIEYGLYGVKSDLSDIDQFGIMSVVLNKFFASIDSAKEKRQKISQARSAAGKKGGAPTGNHNAKKGNVDVSDGESEEENKQNDNKTSKCLKKQAKQAYNVLCNNVNNNIIPPNNISPNGDSSKPKEKTLNAKAKDVFEEYYKTTFGNLYYWTAKDAGNMPKLLQKIKFQIGDVATDEDILQSLKHLLSSITDNWILEHLSVPLLNSKYNEILPKTKKHTDFSMSVNSGWKYEDFDPTKL